jgi:translation elongation factor EF-Tu-like GTPase
MTDTNFMTPPGPALTTGTLRMTIDDVFVITGRGVVAVGIVEAGTVRTGDQVEIRQEGLTAARATVTGVEMFRKIVDEAVAGDHVGLLLGGVAKEDLRRGMVLAAPESPSRPMPRAANQAVHADGAPNMGAPGEVPRTGGARLAITMVVLLAALLAIVGKVRGYY